jgi:hypothetical protein
MKSVWKRFRLPLFIILGIELALRIYNPFVNETKQKKNEPKENLTYLFTQNSSKYLDDTIVHSKNELGFRGSKYNDSATINIICVGGGNTECLYLGDQKHWPFLLQEKLQSNYKNAFVYNAGYEGNKLEDQLTLIKTKIIPLKPTHIVLMSGPEEYGYVPPTNYPSIAKKSNALSLNFLLKLEIIKTFSSFFPTKNNSNDISDLVIKDYSAIDTLTMSENEIIQSIALQTKYLETYRAQLNQLQALCKKNDIKLIIVSQSILFTEDKDLFSNVNLGQIKTGTLNGKTMALIVKQYNKVAFEVSKKTNTPFIPLSSRMPKDSRFYYNGFHFSNEGSEMAAYILYDELIKTLN